MISAACVASAARCACCSSAVSGCAAASASARTVVLPSFLETSALDSAASFARRTSATSVVSLSAAPISRASASSACGRGGGGSAIVILPGPGCIAIRTSFGMWPIGIARGGPPSIKNEAASSRLPFAAATARWMSRWSKLPRAWS